MASLGDTVAEEAVWLLAASRGRRSLFAPDPMCNIGRREMRVLRLLDAGDCRLLSSFNDVLLNMPEANMSELISSIAEAANYPIESSMTNYFKIT